MLIGLFFSGFEFINYAKLGKLWMHERNNTLCGVLTRTHYGNWKLSSSAASPFVFMLPYRYHNFSSISKWKLLSSFSYTGARQQRIFMIKNSKHFHSHSIHNVAYTTDKWTPPSPAFSSSRCSLHSLRSCRNSQMNFLSKEKTFFYPTSA